MKRDRVPCERAREAASARLDGEPISLSATALDHHLATCADCARWVSEAIRLTRQARLDLVGMPDLTERVLTGVVLPARRLARRRRLLRVGLAIAGLIQLCLALPALLGGSIDMPMAQHAAHESAAWSAALGVAFLAAASRPQRGRGLIPLLIAFVGILSVLSLADFLAGAVEVGRLATHLVTVAGLVLVAALVRTERVPSPDSDQRADGRDGQRHGLRDVA